MGRRRAPARTIVGLLVVVWLVVFVASSASFGSGDARSVRVGPLTRSPTTAPRGPPPTELDPRVFEELGLPVPSPVTGAPTVHDINPSTSTAGASRDGPVVASPTVRSSTSVATDSAMKQQLRVDVTFPEATSPPPVTTGASVPPASVSPASVSSALAAPASPTAGAVAGIIASAPSGGSLARTGPEPWLLALLLIGVALVLLGALLLVAARVERRTTD